MASIEQTRREAMGGTVGFFGALGAALRGLGAQRIGSMADAPSRVRAEQSEVFARACGENSNSAMDWLYYAAQLRDDERRHCVRRAIELAYGDEVVMAEVRRLRWS
jgi:hypothetical protein